MRTHEEGQESGGRAAAARSAPESMRPMLEAAVGVSSIVSMVALARVAVRAAPGLMQAIGNGFAEKAEAPHARSSSEA